MMQRKVLNYIVLAAILLIMFAVIAASPMGAAIRAKLLCATETGNCVEAWNTGIVVYPGVPNATMTPSFSIIATSGAVFGKVIGASTPGVLCNRGSTTVTDTVTFTSTVTAITTPAWASCNPNAISADAYNCSAAVGTPGSVVILVKNSAVTPAANAAGASVNWTVCGTN